MTVASRVLIKITARFGSSGGYLFLFTMLMMRAIKAMIKLQNMKRASHVTMYITSPH